MSDRATHARALPLTIAFDHVIVAVPDLDRAAAALHETHGLGSVAGGRHPGHGTANRIVPLGNDYVELMSVVDPAEAAESPMGRWVGEAIASGPSLIALCLRVGDIDEVARRLGRETMALSRAKPDGTVLQCRLAGLDAAMGPQRLPFFIQWDVPEDLHPGRERASHHVVPLGIAWAEIGGESGRLARWIGEHRLDVRAVSGAPGPRSAGIKTVTGDVVLR